MQAILTCARGIGAFLCIVSAGLTFAGVQNVIHQLGLSEKFAAFDIPAWVD